MSVDNTNHHLSFDLEFTLPENYTAEYLQTNTDWFYDFTIGSIRHKRLRIIHLSCSSGTTSGGSGQSQLQTWMVGARRYQ